MSVPFSASGSFPDDVQLSTDVPFTATDGVMLTGDVAVPAVPWAAAIVCHPHPQFGGNRFNPVVDAMFASLPAAGVATLRFDFRAEFGGGVTEVHDAAGAVAELRTRLPDLASAGAPVFAVGYSFGAMVTLGLDAAAHAVAAKVLVAPPLARIAASSAPDVDTLLLVPEHDQFSPPDATAEVMSTWSAADRGRTTTETVAMADHFLSGRTAVVAERTTAWLLERRG